jgi:predicted acyltransferase (DUF342 family)
MSGWAFFAFSIVFGAAVCTHFFVAYRAWRTRKGEQPSDIDPGYVRLEDYFARSFRLKVSEWLKLPVSAATPDGTRTIVKGRERIKVSGSLECPPRTRSDEILVVQGSFRCGAGCTFDREMYVREHASIGAGSRLQSLAVEGNLTLGPGVRITRWVDSAGEMDIGPKSVVGVRATAGAVIRLADGAQVGSAFAPIVTTSTKLPEAPEESVEPAAPEHEIPDLRGAGTATGKPVSVGVRPDKLKELSSDCWLYDGDLKPSAALRVKTGLIVKGECVLPDGSILEGDLKADGRIAIGANSLCRGNVVAGGDISFGRSSRFLGVVHAGKTLRMSWGVRGGGEGMKVAAFAAGALLLADNVLVHGKVASDAQVTVAPVVPTGKPGKRGMTLFD